MRWCNVILCWLFLAVLGIGCSRGPKEPADESEAPERMVGVGEVAVTRADAAKSAPEATATQGGTQFDDDSIPRDTCILELTLPPATEVFADGRNYGTERRLTFRSLGLGAGKFKPVTLRLSFPDTAVEEYNVLVEGGQKIRLASAGPVAREGTLALQLGHCGPVTSVGFSADGRWVVTGSSDDAAHLWDVMSGKEVRRFEGHSSSVKSVALSADGSTLLTAGFQDGTARLWGVATGREIRRFEGPSWDVYSAAFSPDEKQVLTGGSHSVSRSTIEDLTVRLWEIVSGKEVRRFRGHDSPVLSVTFSPDGRQLLTGSSDRTARLWDRSTGRELRRFQGHSGSINAVAFSRDGRRICTGSMDRTARLWDATTGREIRQFEGHDDRVEAVAFSPDGVQVLTGSYDGTARLWNASTGEQTLRLEGHLSWVHAAAFSPDGKHLLTGGQDHTARLWDRSSGKEVRRFEGHWDPVESLALTLDDRKLLIASSSGHLWDLTAGKEILRVRGHSNRITAVAFSPDGQQVATGSWDDSARIWDVTTGKELRRFCGHANSVNAVSFSPDGHQLLTGSWDGTARLWDAATGAETCRFDEHPHGVEAIALSPDSRWVLTAGTWEDSFRLWDVTAGKEIRRFEGHSNSVCSVQFSSDARHVLSGSCDGTALIWNVATGKELRRFDSPNGNVECAAFSPDGRYLVTGAWEGPACLWHSASGEMIRQFEGHSGWVNAVAFSSDCSVLLTGSSDGTIRLWDVATGKELACLISLRVNGGWLVWTPEGLFDGSQSGREKVHFRIGGGLMVVPVDRFFRDLYYPGLLAEIWQGKRPMPDKELGRNPAPELQILLRDPARRDSSQLIVDVAVTDQGGGMQEPWLIHNGFRTGEPEEMRRDSEKLQCSFTVSLVEGENRIEVQSASEDASWDSEPALLTIPYDGELPNPELHILAIGINEYSGGANLEGCVAGARAMIELLKNRAAEEYTEVHVYPDEAGLCDGHATRARIDDAVAVIAEKADPQDTLVVYVAGHGWTIGQRYYLLPHEYRQVKGQTVNDAVRELGLPIDELGSRLSQVPALKRVLIFDTCQSGSVTQLQRSPFEFRGAVERFARSQGIFTLAASAEDAAAFEHPMSGNMGILTFVLLAGTGAIDDKHNLLRGARVVAGSSNGEVDVLDWFHFAERHVPRLAEKLAGQKDYHIEMRGREPDFPLLSLESD